jgi:hypothetical protein
MERTLRVFNSPAEAERADDLYYASLTADERVDVLLELVARYSESSGETTARFERVCRVIELSQC